MRRLAIIALVALVLACQQSPAPGPAPVGSLTVRLKAEGDARAARGDYEGAALRYQQAANQEPEDVSIRFALGSALSHLNRREDTIQQFRFVVARGKPDSSEAQAALRWLIAAGEVAESVTFAPPESPKPEAVPPAPAFVATGKVKGRAAGKGTGEVNLALKGDDDRNRELAFSQTVKMGEPYEFDAPPGNYRLTAEDRETGEELWDVPVTVTAGKEIVVDLK